MANIETTLSPSLREGKIRELDNFGLVTMSAGDGLREVG
jgi:hypothetical protein